MKTTGNNHCYLYRLLFYKGELSELRASWRGRSGKGLAPSTVGSGLVLALDSGSPGRARQILVRLCRGALAGLLAFWG